MFSVNSFAFCMVPLVFLCIFFLSHFFFTVVLHIILIYRQLPLKEHPYFDLQLPVCSVRVGDLLFIFLSSFLLFVLCFRWKCSRFLLCVCWISCGGFLIVRWVFVDEINEYFSNVFLFFCCTLGITICCYFYRCRSLLCTVYVSVAENLHAFGAVSKFFWLRWRWFYYKDCQITHSLLIVGSAWLLIASGWKMCVCNVVCCWLFLWLICIFSEVECDIKEM